MAIRLDNISLEFEMRLVLPVPVQASPTEPNRDPSEVDVGRGNSKVPQDSIQDALLQQEIH
jgi:hypothetical protein